MQLIQSLVLTDDERVEAGEDEQESGQLLGHLDGRQRGEHAGLLVLLDADVDVDGGGELLEVVVGRLLQVAPLEAGVAVPSAKHTEKDENDIYTSQDKRSPARYVHLGRYDTYDRQMAPVQVRWYRSNTYYRYFSFFIFHF